MPVPSKMQDLSTLAASNSPSGSDSIGNSLDDYLRAVQAIVRSTNAQSSASIASSATVDLGTSDGEAVTVTGTTTITSFGTSVPGLVREVTFSGTLTITNSSAIALAGSANYTTKAGDVIRFRSLGSGNWQQVGQTPLGYTPVQQGTGVGQSPTNAIKIGWSGTKIKATVDAVDQGNMALESWVTTNFSANANPTISGQLSQNLGSLGTTAGNGLLASIITATDANTDTLRTFIQRASSGATFGTAVWRVQRVVDATTFGYLQFGDTTNTRNTIIGNDLGGTWTLDASGNCTASGTVTCTNLIATSDESLKKRIRKVKANDRLADLLELCTWLWRDGSGQGKGVIAQRAKEVAPEYVYESEAGILGVDKAGLALECVIGLAARVRELEGK